MKKNYKNLSHLNIQYFSLYVEPTHSKLDFLQRQLWGQRSHRLPAYTVISFSSALRGVHRATWSSISCPELVTDEKLGTTVTATINTPSTPSHFHLGGL